MENNVHSNLTQSTAPQINPIENSKTTPQLTNKKKNNKGKKKKKWYSIPLIILYVLLGIVGSIVITLFVLNILFKGVYVSGYSMQPTLDDGDFLYMRRHASPNRGDIIVIQATYEGEELRVIKRVIGLGGDRVYQENGRLMCQREGQEPQDCGSIGNHLEFKEVVVELNHVFVCGDNRTNSSDSRTASFGTLSLNRLEGVVTPWSIQFKAQLKVIYQFFNNNKVVRNSINEKEYIYGEKEYCTTI